MTVIFDQNDRFVTKMTVIEVQNNRCDFPK